MMRGGDKLAAVQVHSAECWKGVTLQPGHQPLGTAWLAGGLPIGIVRLAPPSRTWAHEQARPSPGFLLAFAAR